MRRTIIFLTLVLLWGYRPIVQAAPTATITVTNNADSGAGTLRQAILDANAGDTIRFSGDMTISHASDLPSIDFALTIDGEDNNITLRGNTTARSGVVLEDGADVTLRNLTMENGSLDFGSNGGAIDATEDNGGTDFAVDGDFPKKLTIENSVFRNNNTVASFNGRTSHGGAIAAEGTRLVIRDSSFIGNFTDETSNDQFNNGGAIYLRNGHLTIERTFFDDNSARNGGAIWIDGSFQKIDTILHISDSTFEDNEATKPQVTAFSHEGGGAVYFGPYTTDVIIRDSLFERNTAAASGGALRNAASADNPLARIENNTFYDNHAGFRGGALLLEYASIDHATITSNTAANAGGGISATTGTVVRNSILANNAIDDDGIGASGGLGDCYSTSATATFANTLVEVNEADTCDLPLANGNIVGDDPDFANSSPTNNGGETQTIGLNSGSPAIGAASVATCAATDQRGYLRTGTSCDMGAWEANTAVRCATNDGITVRFSFTAEALHLALAANSGNDIKVAGTCTGATNVGNVIGDSDSEIVSVYIDQSFDLEGGHKVVDWNLAPDNLAYPTVIDALGAGRVVIVAPNQTTTLAHLTLQNGVVLTATTNVNGQGGVIFSADSSTLTLQNVTLQNGVGNAGGLLYANNTTLNITDSVLRDGDALGRGGGLYTIGSATTTIARTALFDNAAGASGGAIQVSGSGATTLTNSTLSSNVSARGAGLRLESIATVTATNVTIANNDATFAGLAGGVSAVGTLTLDNTILADSGGGVDCETFGTLTVRFSLIEDGSCGITNGVDGNVIADPDLEVLGRYGAQTWTHDLNENTPPHNAASNATCLPTDQRGYQRIDGACDMGAHEINAGVPLAVGLSGQSAVSGEQWVTLALALLMLFSVGALYRRAR